MGPKKGTSRERLKSFWDIGEVTSPEIRGLLLFGKYVELSGKPPLVQLALTEARDRKLTPDREHTLVDFARSLGQ